MEIKEFLQKDLLSTVKYKTSRNNQIMMLCPYHTESSPSFSVNIETGLHCCFSCGATGNITDLTAKLKGLSTTVAYKMLIDKGVVKGNKRSHNVAIPTAFNVKINLEDELWIDNLFNKLVENEVIVSNIPANFGKHLEDYLKKKRGFSKDFLNNSKDAYILQKDVRLEFNDSVVKWGSGNLLFAYKDANNELTTLKYHDTNTEKKDDKLYLPSAKIGAGFFKAIVDSTQRLCLVVEGEMDALALNSCGYNAIAVGSLQRLPVLTHYLINNIQDRIFICLPDFNLKLTQAEGLENKASSLDVGQHFLFIQDVEYKDVCEGLLLNKNNFLTTLNNQLLPKIIGNYNFYVKNQYFGLYVVSGKNRFIYRNKKNLVVQETIVSSATQYAVAVGNYLFGTNTKFNYLVKSERFKEATALHYNPFVIKLRSNPAVSSAYLYEDDGDIYLNTYVAGGYHALRETMHGRSNINKDNYLTVFKKALPNLHDYLTRVLNTAVNGDKALRFYINLIALKWHEPNYKIAKIIVLQGNQGSGKGTIANIMRKLFGESAITEGGNTYGNKFNTEFANKLFWFLDEVEGNAKMQEYYANLKRDTGSVVFRVEGKNDNTYTIENYATPIIASNQLAPVVKPTKGDRRIVYFTSRWNKNKNTPTDTTKYFVKFYEELKTEIVLFAEFVNGFTDYDKTFINTYKSYETELEANTKDEIELFFGNLLSNPTAEIEIINEFAEKKNMQPIPMLNSNHSKAYYIGIYNGKLLINYELLCYILDVRFNFKVRVAKTLLNKLNDLCLPFSNERACHSFTSLQGQKTWYTFDMDIDVEIPDLTSAIKNMEAGDEF